MTEKCPYCSKEMLSGELGGDGRSPVRFEAEGDKDNGWDIAYQRGRVCTASVGKFKLPALYCTSCEKLIISAKVNGYTSD